MEIFISLKFPLSLTKEQRLNLIIQVHEISAKTFLNSISVLLFKNIVHYFEDGKAQAL